VKDNNRKDRNTDEQEEENNNTIENIVHYNNLENSK